jgi:steroid 5-alpha reductase family enzyme
MNGPPHIDLHNEHAGQATGKRLLEKHMARSRGAAYADYVRRTSGFIPWPPR